MKSKPTEISRRRADERGAALVTSLLIAMLMLAAGGALIATAGMSASNTVDATAEVQAYYAADAGLQAALTVLRRNRAGSGGLAANFHNFACGTASACTNDGDNLAAWGLGADVTLSASPQLSYTVTVSDPSRASTANLAANYYPRYLFVTSVGRGPKGATKVLQMMVDNYPFDFTAHAAVAIRSNDTDTVGMLLFTLGTSNPHTWSGNDNASLAPAVPAFTVTNTADYDAGDGFGLLTLQGRGEAAVGADNSNIDGDSLIEKLAPSSLESWLQTAANCRAFLTQMRARAAAQGRLNPGDLGSDSAPKFTFIDGDLTLGGNDTGAGLMIVTGTITQGGNSSFHGVVLALGNGIINRNGTPGALGAILVANLQHNYDSTTGSYTGTGGFGSPTITSAGGGNALVGYDSEWVRKAMESGGARAVGFVEK